MDILVDLKKFDHLLGMDADELKAEASGRSLEENLKILSDIRFYLILTNRWINLIACGVGFWGVASVIVMVHGFTSMVLMFLNISLIAFPFYYYVVFDRSYQKVRNLGIRHKMIKYKLILKDVIHQQRVNNQLNYPLK